MEVSPPPVLVKRLWNIIRIAFYMIRKGISKRKLMVDLHLMMKRGKIAGKKAIGSLMFHHHHHHHHHHHSSKPNFSCRTNEANMSLGPREYEFSCSNSPAFPFFHLNTSTRRSKNHHNYFSCIHPSAPSDDDIAALHKALEMLDSDAPSSATSPFSALPGFGKSPMVRQLRITDSPFPLRDTGDEDNRVDKEAEEFIGRFYDQLRLQNQMAALESKYREMTMLRTSD